ncbi:MAG: preprotein translocase subunit SecG [Chloroflexi bacterium]|nr:preprotein translocase subunit SecG [Chloroflexota bacterium]MCH2308670.1 preprotein translocase subunit SecG [SAR202 cluster bacterium]
MTLLNSIQIILSVTLVIVVLLQVRGQGGGLFGGGESSYHTRRGIEKVLFQATIVLVVLFLITSILSVRCVSGLFPC